LEYAAEASSPIAPPQHNKKMKKVLTSEATKTSKGRKTTKKMKAGNEETSKLVTVPKEVTNKRVSRKRLIMDL
jgi:hypothetical protein